jgi:hypothetical protein
VVLPPRFLFLDLAALGRITLFDADAPTLKPQTMFCRPQDHRVPTQTGILNQIGRSPVMANSGTKVAIGEG